MADNTTINAGTGGDVIRDKDRAGIKTQIVALDLNPAGTESLMAGVMPVSGTFWQTTQPVSATSLPLPSGAAQDGTDATGVTAPTGAVGIRGWLSGIYSKLSGTLTTSATVSNFPATQTVAGTVTANAGTGTMAVSLATNTPDVTDRAARLLGHVTVDNASLAVTQAAITKGTQGANGVTTQDLKDAGRTAVILSATAIASVTTEAMFTLNIWKAGTVTSGTSYTVTTGKTFRLQSIQFGMRMATPSTTVTFATARFNLRSGGTTTSPLIYGDTKLSATNTPTPNSDLAIPDGLEFAAGTVLGVSHIDSATTALLDLLIVGYEY